MTGKKKLNLGPLPEELDYSKYEETVTRWDRVIAVVLAGLILLALLAYLFLGSSKPSSEIALVEQELVVPLSADLSENTQAPAENDVTELPVSEVPAKAEEPVLPADTEEKNKIPDVKEFAEISEVSDVSEVQPEAASEMQQAQAKSATESRAASAVVDILNAAITQAILTDELADNGPGTPLAETLILPESGITKVMLFTDMQGLLGRTLYHDWYRNGERQARVKVPVNYNEQRSFSSKFINLQMTGDWQVKVVDGKGKPYIDAAFKVIRP